MKNRIPNIGIHGHAGGTRPVQTRKTPKNLSAHESESVGVRRVWDCMLLKAVGKKKNRFVGKKAAGIAREWKPPSVICLRLILTMSATICLLVLRGLSGENAGVQNNSYCQGWASKFQVVLRRHCAGVCSALCGARVGISFARIRGSAHAWSQIAGSATALENKDVT